MIAWGSSEAGTALTAEQSEAFERVLSGHSWVRAFPGVAVVALVYEAERQELIDGLVEVAKGIAEKQEGSQRAHILVSPPIPKQGGTYSGWAAKKVWPELNKRSVE
jgi:hypothetical protein